MWRNLFSSISECIWAQRIGNLSGRWHKHHLAWRIYICIQPICGVVICRKSLRSIWKPPPSTWPLEMPASNRTCESSVGSVECHLHMSVYYTYFVRHIDLWPARSPCHTRDVYQRKHIQHYPSTKDEYQLGKKMLLISILRSGWIVGWIRKRLRARHGLHTPNAFACWMAILCVYVFYTHLNEFDLPQFLRGQLGLNAIHPTLSK